MSFVGRMLNGLESRASLREPPDWLWDAFGGTKTVSGKSVTTDTSLGLIPVFAAVRLLAGTIGSLPLIVYRGRGRERVRARDSRQWALLHDEPNSENAADQVWENVTGHLNLWGNAFLEKVRDRRFGVVGELWPLNPAHVHVDRDSKMRKVFEVDGNARTFDEKTILHIPAFGYDGLVGLSPVRQARETLGAAMAREEYAARFYANDARPGGILRVVGDLTDERARRLRDRWQAFQGGENAGRVAVLEQGAEWQAIGMPLKDQEFVAASRFTVTQVARLFGVPPEMIGGDRESSMTYSTVEGQALYFVVFSLRRWLVRIEKALLRDRELFPDASADLYPEFLVDGLLRGDSKTRWEIYKIGREIGVFSPNDIAELENRPPRDGGDIYQETISGAAPNAEAEEDDEDRARLLLPHLNGKETVHA